MNVLVYVGIALIVIGALWILYYFRPPRQRGAAPAAAPPPWLEPILKVVDKLLGWATKNMPRAARPGVFVMMVGILLVIIGVVAG